MATSKSQLKASKTWDDKNRERKRYINLRSNARRFIKKHATIGDIKELRELITDREKQLNEDK